MTIKTDAYIIGSNADDTRNFLLDTDLAGALRIRRKSDGSGGALFSIDANGNTVCSAPVFDNSAAATDVALLLGQTAYIDVAGVSSKALRIATGDNQLYEIVCQMDSNATNDTQFSAFLNPNNATFTNFFKNDVWTEVGSSPSAVSTYQSAFCIGTYGVRAIRALVSTRTKSKWVNFTSLGLVTTGNQTYALNGFSQWQAAASSGGSGDITTAWSSLGTLTFTGTVTGRIYIKRVG